MDPKVDPPTGSTTPGETRSDLEATLRRVEARLERLEQAFEPIVKATTAAPAFTSTAADVIDEWANGHGDLDSRLRTLSGLVERLTRPRSRSICVGRPAMSATPKKDN
jgi:ABC-type transporter Mla subunit MlaD